MREGTRNVLIVFAAVLAAGCAVAAVRRATSKPEKRPLIADVRARSRFEVRLLDDDFEIPEAAIPQDFAKRVESARKGPDRTIGTHTYILVRLASGKSRDAATVRGDAWARTLALPPGETMVWEDYKEWDPATQVATRIGVRSFLLKNEPPIVTARDIAHVEPKVDTQGGSAEVALEITLSPVAAVRFEQATEANVQRRIAIIVDGRVHSAPIVHSKIAGGIVRITMGEGDPGKLIEDAKNLAADLGSP